MHKDSPAKTLLSYTAHQKWEMIVRILFYTSLLGFLSGITLGYLYLQGWVHDAENSMVI